MEFTLNRHYIESEIEYDGRTTHVISIDIILNSIKYSHDVVLIRIGVDNLKEKINSMIDNILQLHNETTTL